MNTAEWNHIRQAKGYIEHHLSRICTMSCGIELGACATYGVCADACVAVEGYDLTRGDLRGD